MTINTSSRQDSQTLNGIGPIAGASQELVDALQKIVRNAEALLDVDDCSVALLDAGGSSLVTLAALQKQGRRPRHTRFQHNEGVAGWVAEHREPLIINDVSLDPRFKRLGRSPIGSMVCVPLFDKEEFIGTLTASSPEKAAFDERKLRVLTIFSEQAVLAFVNARQAEVARRQADQLETLISLSQGITTRLEADDLYRTILLNVRRLVPAQRFVIYTYQQRSQLLRPVAEISDEEGASCSQEVRAAPVKIGESRRESINISSPVSLEAWAALHRHPMLYAPEQNQQDEEGAAETGATSAKMEIPLVSKETLYGVLVLQRPTAFNSEELRLMRNLGNMAAAALENRDLMRMKANFLSMITHELRSPINAINGYLDLALTGIAGDLNEQQREFVRRARGGSEHLYALVEDLLLVSRADSGQLRLNRSITSLPELIANSVEELELTASDNDITIVASIPDDFPRLYADGTRIQQVLRNLISNALHFTPSGGSVTISASVVDDASTAPDGEERKSFAVQVRDTGSGIVPEYQERIFERFYQIPLEHTGRTSGQGLGLAIVKMIVELHGGFVRIESTPGEGSAFTFTIPGILS